MGTRRLARTLVRAGVLVEEAEQPWLDLEVVSPLEQLAAAAVRYRIALGPLAGRKTMGSSAVKPLTAARDGFSLNAAIACRAHQREKLERLSVDGDGLAVYELKHPFRDGTTHMLFEPLDFLPRPRAHLVQLPRPLRPEC